MIDPKEFKMDIVTPHELFMALEPETFTWESIIYVDFSKLLAKLKDTHQDKEKVLESIEQVSDEQAMALV